MSNIKIPTIRIYDKENDKYIDNVVTSVDYSTQNIVVRQIKDEDGGVVVERTISEGFVEDPGTHTSWKNDNSTIGSGGISDSSPLSTYYMQYYVYIARIDVSFPRGINNNKKYIFSINLGDIKRDDNGFPIEYIPYTTFSTVGVLTKGDCDVTIGFTERYSTAGLYTELDYDYTNTPSEFSGDATAEDYETSIEEKFSKLYENIDVLTPTNERSASVNVTWDRVLLESASWDFDDNDNIVIHNLGVPVMYYAWYPKDVAGANIDENYETISGPYITRVGHYTYTLEKFEPKSLTLNIRATYREVEESSTDKTYPNNSATPSGITVEKNVLADTSTIILKAGLEYADTSQDCSNLLTKDFWESTTGDSGSIIRLKADQKKNYESPLSVFRTDTIEPEFIGFIKSVNDEILLGYTIQSFSAYKCVSLADYAPRRIYSIWKNGKETATIRVSINDYYDTDGNLAVSISDDSVPMLFKNGDIVIPYVATPNGDRPMSSKPDGTPKEFLVTGVTLISDGAVWQELQLQEVSG